MDQNTKFVKTGIMGMLINNMDRRIMREHPESFTAATLRLYLAQCHLRRELTRTKPFMYIRNLAEWMNNKLTK